MRKFKRTTQRVCCVPGFQESQGNVSNPCLKQHRKEQEAVGGAAQAQQNKMREAMLEMTCMFTDGGANACFLWTKYRSFERSYAGVILKAPNKGTSPDKFQGL